MAISTKIEYAKIEDLYLDPLNPRLGRIRIAGGTPQDELLQQMQEWVLDELALSYLENGGFWSHEPLLVVEEKLYGKKQLVVVEGNRRLAALLTLEQAFAGEPCSKKWNLICEDYKKPKSLFDTIPFVKCDHRDDVAAYLGFRHVTGIKQWNTDEKAAYIAKLIDSGLSYLDVARKIGSKSPTVRKHYVAFTTLRQIEDEVESFEPEYAARRFAVLYMTITTLGARKYLNIEIDADQKKLKVPVPKSHLKNLENFALWLFGTDAVEPLVKDTRQVSKFSGILENEKSVDYLETKKRPNFDVAVRISGGDESETIQYVSDAADNVEMALMRAHAFRKSEELVDAVKRFGEDSLQLLDVFPEVKSSLLAGDQ